MPRTIQEILDHADELAQEFEVFDPADGTERHVSEYLLQRAALAELGPNAKLSKRSRLLEPTASHGRKSVRCSAPRHRLLNSATAASPRRCELQDWIG
jgi:hypothetical protein